MCKRKQKKKPFKEFYSKFTETCVSKTKITVEKDETMQYGRIKNV